MQYETCSGLQQFVADNYNLFALFEEVYLFGSVLSGKSIPNDIDMLLVYFDDTEKFLPYLQEIRKQVNEKFKYQLDLTVLSRKEFEETQFLEKIRHFERIK